jgi:hypothetical protein
MSAQIILTIVNARVKPGECVKLEDIKREAARAHGLARAKVVDYCETLVRRGFLERQVYTGMRGQPCKPGCYTMTASAKAFLDEGRRIASGQTRDGKRQRLVTGGLRAKAWSAMRILKKFGLGDLLKHIADGSELDATSNLGKYVRALCAAGYLTELRREPGTAMTSNGFKRYLLVRDTGLSAPVWNQRAGTVTDPNTLEVFPMIQPDAVLPTDVAPQWFDAVQAEMRGALHV